MRTLILLVLSCRGSYKQPSQYTLFVQYCPNVVMLCLAQHLYIIQLLTFVGVNMNGCILSFHSHSNSTITPERMVGG